MLLISLSAFSYNFASSYFVCVCVCVCVCVWKGVSGFELKFLITETYHMIRLNVFHTVYT